jgi:hypothetical protein
MNNQFSQILPLSDYINTDFYTSPTTENRNDIILYNPKKGYKYTKELIKLTPGWTWIPLQGLTVDEMINLFKISKIYVDFGFHPGKDRIPREAALNGCCIITGRKGSANYFEDVAIFDYYKIDEIRSSKAAVISRIREVLIDYDHHFRNFDFYRERILEEKKIFEKHVKDIFVLVENN